MGQGLDDKEAAEEMGFEVDLSEPNNIFFVGDTHFHHEKILTYSRTWFKNIVEHDTAIVQAWNKVVGKNDLVYHLGDVSWSRKGFEYLAKCNGRKRLIMGNHDAQYPASFLLQYFDRIYGIAEIDEIIVLSHAPLHNMNLAGRWLLNIHGHLHDAQVNRYLGSNKWGTDPRYRCVSLEQLKRYEPIELRQIYKEFKGLKQARDNVMQFSGPM